MVLSKPVALLPCLICWKQHKLLTRNKDQMYKTYRTFGKIASWPLRIQAWHTTSLRHSVWPKGLYHHTHRQAFRLPSKKKLQPATTKSITYSVARWFEFFVRKFQERLSHEARAFKSLVRFGGLVCHQHLELLRPADSRGGRRDRA